MSKQVKFNTAHLNQSEQRIFAFCMGNNCYYDPETCRGSSDPNDSGYCDNYLAMLGIWDKIKPTDHFMKFETISQ
jgi:hypothetical protein